MWCPVYLLQQMLSDSGLYSPQHPLHAWETLLRRIFAPATCSARKGHRWCGDKATVGLRLTKGQIEGSNEALFVIKYHHLFPDLVSWWTTSFHLTCALAKPDVCKHSCSPCLDGCQFTKRGHGQKHTQVANATISRPNNIVHFSLSNHPMWFRTPYEYGSIFLVQWRIAQGMGKRYSSSNMIQYDLAS